MSDSDSSTNSTADKKDRATAPMKKIGIKLEVWNNLALKTLGGLYKKDLVLNKRGKVVSKRKSEMMRHKNNFMK